MPTKKTPFRKLYFSKGGIEERELRNIKERDLKKIRLEQDFRSGSAMDTLICNLGL